ncbi:MAG: PEP-CTERM sorting domain-containing protein [Bryobacteraceae bacterium]
MNRLKFAALAATVMSLTCMGAMADTVTDIDLSGHTTGNWGTYTTIPLFNGTDIAAASTNGNQGTGLTFANWNGDFDLIASGTSDTITFAGPVALNSNSVVNTLVNTFFGTSGATETTVSFASDNGSTAQYSLVGGQTIRDYNNLTFTNDLQGYNNDSSLGNVTAQNWWNNYGTGGHQRLDAQTFVLPSSWTGSNLLSMTIDTPSGLGQDDTILSAAQISVQSSTPSSPVPEPSSLALVLVALALGGFVARRRLSKRTPL